MSHAELFTKARLALLRMVGAWLMMATWFAARPARRLPRRLSAWVDSLICKAELATINLRTVAGKIRLEDRPSLEELAYDGHLTIGNIISRLKAIVKALRGLCLAAKRDRHIQNAAWTKQSLTADFRGLAMAGETRAHVPP